MVVVDFCFVTQGILMSLVGTCGIIGNILAIIVITRREMRVTSTNYVLMGMKITYLCIKMGPEYLLTCSRWLFFRKCNSFFKSPNLPKKIFQKTILSLKFKIPAHNSIMCEREFQVQDSFLEYLFFGDLEI